MLVDKRQFLSEEEKILEHELQDLKDFAIQNNMVDNDGYIWSISILRKYNKRFLHLMCYVYDIKYSAYDNKTKLLERLFNDILF